MSTGFNLKADTRKNIGSSDSRRVRRSGNIPAVVYGKGGKNLNITVPSKEFEKEYFKGNLFTTIVNLELDGKTIQTIPHDVDFNPVTDRPIHVDFIQFEKGQKVKAKVRVKFFNKEKSPGIKKGGFLHIVLRKVSLICDPDLIPEEVRVDVGTMRVGDKVRSVDIDLPENVEFAKKGEFNIASIIGRGAKEEEESAEAVEGEEGEVAEGGKEGEEEEGGEKK